MTSWDPSAWGEVHEHRSLASFAAGGPPADGVHRIPLDAGSGPLEVLLRGRPLAPRPGRAVPVFTTAAVARRDETTGPYFSGRGLASELRAGYVAIADPLLARDPELRLAWYTGTVGSRTVETILAVCARLTDVAERPLAFIGGSGAGFASMRLAAETPGSRAFVWNPQTEILDYDVSAVRDYLRVLLGGSWDDPAWKTRAQAALDDAGIVNSIRRDQLPERFFYLQGSTDWHVAAHLAPFLEAHRIPHHDAGWYSDAPHRGVLLATFGQHHAAPPTAFLREAVGRYLELDATAADIRRLVVERDLAPDTDVATLPADLRARAATLIAGSRIEVAQAGTQYRCTVRTEREDRSPLTYIFLATSGSERLVRTNPGPDDCLEIDDARELTAVKVWLRDGFSHALGDLEWRRRDGGLRAGGSTLVHGSCVSRDMFEVPGAPPLHSYHARSCLGSALSPLTSGLDVGTAAPGRVPFAERVVREDLGRDLPDILGAGGYVAVLVDLVDERLGLCEIPGHGPFTLSKELLARRDLPEEARRIPLGGPEHLQSFAGGWARLASLVPPESLVVNKVWWASHDSRGEPLPDQAGIAEQNLMLRRMYDVIEAHTPTVRWLEYPEHLVRADPEHRWGSSPFHYWAPFYEHAAEELHRLVAGCPLVPPSPPCTPEGACA